jgi:hypothetical protein
MVWMYSLAALAALLMLHNVARRRRLTTLRAAATEPGYVIRSLPPRSERFTAEDDVEVCSTGSTEVVAAATATTLTVPAEALWTMLHVDPGAIAGGTGQGSPAPATMPGFLQWVRETLDAKGDDRGLRRRVLDYVTEQRVADLLRSPAVRTRLADSDCDSPASLVADGDLALPDVDERLWRSAEAVDQLGRSGTGLAPLGSSALAGGQGAPNVTRLTGRSYADARASLIDGLPVGSLVLSRQVIDAAAETAVPTMLVLLETAREVQALREVDGPPDPVWQEPPHRHRGADSPTDRGSERTTAGGRRRRQSGYHLVHEQLAAPLRRSKAALRALRRAHAADRAGLMWWVWPTEAQGLRAAAVDLATEAVGLQRRALTEATRAWDATTDQFDGQQVFGSPVDGQTDVPQPGRRQPLTEAFLRPAQGAESA